MTEHRLSIIIPSYKDPYLHKTIEELLTKSEGDIEIIVVLDGYWPTKAIVNDSRVRIVHLGKNVGMRDAINTGVSIATGEYLMRTDEHCMFAQGFDTVLTRDCEDKMIMIPRRYYLDVEKWEIMTEIPPNDYDKLVIDKGHNKFSGLNWKSRAEERKDIMIDETMAFQGSCWVMKKSWWEKVVVELDTANYGQLYQDSHEMSFKTWRAGGRLMTNKNTWFAHKHRKFKRTHNNGTPENPSNNRACFDYSLKTWYEDYLLIKEKWKI